jgi:hypothetical protein
MISTETQKRSNWFTKFSLSFLAIVGASNAALFVILPILPFRLTQYIVPAGLSTLIIAILFSVGFSFYWHYKEKKGGFSSDKYHTWLTTLLRYWLAFHISIFGFEKIFEVNFAHSYHVHDSLVNTLTGPELTWVYYGYSYELSLIVCLFQIIGSILLLFRRTQLLGIAALLPVFFNIVLINLFYSIGLITAFTSIAITLGLTYLLLQRKEDIIALFRHYKNTLPSLGNNTLRIVARVFCIIIPCSFIIYYKNDVYASEKYFGKWKVESMVRNGKSISDSAWEKDSLAWKTIYIEERGKIFYCPNPHMYVDSTSILMKYDYNDKDDALKVISYEHNPVKPDTIPVQINKYTTKSMHWNMVFGSDTIQMQLKKVNN